MNRLKKTCLLVITVCCATGLWAQDDFGIWTSVSGSKKIVNGLTVGVEGEMRTRDNTREIDRWAAGLDVSYKPFTFLKFGVGYTYIYNHTASETSVKYGETDKGRPKKTIKDTPSFWHSRHRFNADIAGSWDFGRFTISLRERYQMTYRTASDSIATKAKYVYNKVGEGENPYTEDNLREGYPEYEKDNVKSATRNVLRSRLQVAYNIKKCKFNPYASVEFYNSLEDGFSTDKTRWTIGTEYKLTKKDIFDFCYRYLNETDEDDVNRHVLGIGYTHKF